MPDRTVPGIVGDTGALAHPEFFRRLVENAPGAVFVHENEGIIRYANQAAVDLFGTRDAEALVGRNYLDFVHPDEIETAGDRVRKHNAGVPSLGYVVRRILRPDGNVRYVSTTGIAFTEGGRRYVQGFAVDVTEQIAHEHRLRESDAKFAAAFQGSVDAMTIVRTRDGTILEVNRAYEELVGLARDELIGHTLQSLGLSASPEARAAMVEKLFADGRVLDMPWPVRTRSGDTRETLHSAFVIATGEDGRHVTIQRDVTEQRRRERDLRESQARVSAAFQASPDAMVISRVRDGVVLDMNPAHERLTGYAHAELVGANPLKLGIVVDASARRTLVRRLGRSGSVRDFPMRMRHKSGMLRECLQSSVAIEVDGVPCMFSVVRDVTDTLRAERALRRLAEGTKPGDDETVLETLLGNLADALGVSFAWIGLVPSARPDWIEVAASIERGVRSARRSFALSGTAAALVLQGEPFLCESGARERFPSSPHIQAHGIDAVAGAPLRFADDRLVGVLMVASTEPIGDTDPVRSLLQVFSERVSRELERRETESALRKSEDRLRQAIRVSDIGIFDHDHATDTIYWSPEMRDIYGWTQDEPVTILKFLTSVHPEEVDLVAARVRRCHDPAGNGSFELENRIRHRDGATRWVSTRAQTFFGIDPHTGTLRPVRTVGAVVDITDERRDREQVERLNAELEKRVEARTADLGRALDNLREAQGELVRSEKMAALGELVAGIAHEINTPVGIGVTAASHLEQRVGQLAAGYRAGELSRAHLEQFLESATEAAAMISGNLKRAADLIRSFKQVAVDQSSAQRRAIDLGHYLDEILLSLSPQLKRTRHRVETDCGQDIHLTTDPGALSQIVTNLVMNALMHGFDGVDAGTIRIEVRDRPDTVTIGFGDDGRGIAPEHIERIFDPFFTTRRGRGGSGLGLHIVYNLVTQTLGGTIHCTSRPGEGTRFDIEIPRHHD